MFEALIKKIAKVAPWEALLSILRDHIHLVETGAPHGKDFLVKTCFLILAKYELDVEEKGKTDSERSSEINDLELTLKKFNELLKNK